jgi:sugar lactone lactonase YvrE
MTTRALLVVSSLLACWAVPVPASAWDRGPVNTFAVLPEGSGGPEGIEVDPRGNVYVASLGIAADGPVGGPARIFVYDRSGRLLRQLEIAEASQLLGLGWRAATGTLLAIDFGNRRVLEVNPLTGASSVFMELPLAAEDPSSPNDLTFDRAGNVYVSDSFQGTIWRANPDGSGVTAWIENEPLLQTSGVPPFGANGLRFDNAETALYVANTGNDTVVRFPIAAGQPGAPELFTNSVNGADGLLVDEDDNLWVAANQADEIVVLDPSGRTIAKLGDFEGVRRGVPRGLLFPASLRFHGNRLLVTNLALDLRLFSADFVTGDSAWTAQVVRYTVASLPARLPEGRGFGEERGAGSR